MTFALCMVRSGRGETKKGTKLWWKRGEKIFSFTRENSNLNVQWKFRNSNSILFYCKRNSDIIIFFYKELLKMDDALIK